jgi:hypothetical protein
MDWNGTDPKALGENGTEPLVFSAAIVAPPIRTPATVTLANAVRYFMGLSSFGGGIVFKRPTLYVRQWQLVFISVVSFLPLAAVFRPSRRDSWRYTVPSPFSKSRRDALRSVPARVLEPLSSGEMPVFEREWHLRP